MPLRQPPSCPSGQGLQPEAAALTTVRPRSSQLNRTRRPPVTAGTFFSSSARQRQPRSGRERSASPAAGYADRGRRRPAGGRLDPALIVAGLSAACCSSGRPACRPVLRLDPRYAGPMPRTWSRLHEHLGAPPGPVTFEMVRQSVDDKLGEADDLDWKESHPRRTHHLRRGGPSLVQGDRHGCLQRAAVRFVDIRDKDKARSQRATVTPHRDGSHTAWMAEHQIARAYAGRLTRAAEWQAAFDELRD